MNKLIIKQDPDITVTVPNSVIVKLYNLTQTVDTYNSDDIVGSLTINGATYRAYVDYLTQKYPGLKISANKYYMLFEDQHVQDVLKNGVFLKGNIEYRTGDGVGTTEDVFRDIPLWFAEMFKDNANITTFNEMQYSNAQEVGARAFKNCSNLRSVNLKNITTLGAEAFHTCRQLVSLGDISQISSIANSAFIWNTSLNGTLVFPSATECQSQAFRGCTNISEIEFGPNLTTIHWQFIWEAGHVNIIFRGTTPPAVQNGTFPLNNSKQNITFYVPYGCKATYVANDGFASVESKIIELNQDGSKPA